MAAFLDPLCVQEIDDSVFEVCSHDFCYQSDVAKRIFTVPVGFYTDFASVPRLGILYAMLGDTAHEPAVVHDWLYYTQIVSRETADNILFEAMGVIGMPWWRRYPIWWGVRVGGWYAWNQHAKNGDPTNGKFANTPDILNKK